MGKLLEQRPSYHVLGLLLFIQLAVSGGSWALRHASYSGMHLWQTSAGDASAEKALRPALLLQVRARGPPST
jgi:hypothetical protein